MTDEGIYSYACWYAAQRHDDVPIRVALAIEDPITRFVFSQLLQDLVQRERPADVFALDRLLDERLGWLTHLAQRGAARA